MLASSTLASNPLAGGSPSVSVEVELAGTSAASAAGQVVVAISDTAFLTGVLATAALGQVTPGVPNIVVITQGVQAQTQSGAVFAFTSVSVPVAGLGAAGVVGQVLVWGPVVPTSDVNWINVAPSHDPGYSPVIPGSVPNWTAIAT